MLAVNQKNIQTMALYSVSTYSTRTSFRDHLSLIKSFISEMRQIALDNHDTNTISHLAEFENLFNHIFKTDQLKPLLLKLKHRLLNGHFTQEKGTELFVDTIRWHNQFEKVMKHMKGRENDTVFESFYKQLIMLYFKVSKEKNRMINILSSIVLELNH